MHFLFLGSNVKSLRKPLQLRLPVFSENQDLFDVTVLIKKTDSDEWENKEFIMLVSVKTRVFFKYFHFQPFTSVYV